jgi:outer membrane protein TolC
MLKSIFFRTAFDTRLIIRQVTALTLLITSITAFGAPRDLQNVIDDYVAESMRSNLALQAETYTVQQAKASLDAARAHYLPELSLDARYTRSRGGRDISFPIGDALNPVYSTLNQMLEAQGQPGKFPQIENVTIPFLRAHEQDTHISLRQPLFAPAISAGVRAQESMLGAAQQQRIAYARQLRRDVTVAYLNWLKSGNIVQIVSSTSDLLAENLRVNESLFNNGKVTQDQPLRARAELLDVQQQLQQANDAKQQAQSYVNFLLNRPLDTALEESIVPAELNTLAIDVTQSRKQAIERRAELQQLDKAAQAAQHQVTIAKSASIPMLSLGVDSGIQGDDYGFDSQHRYTSASLVLTWKFYAGGGMRAQVDAANAQARRLAAQRDSAQQQVALQVQQAVDRYRTAISSLGVATARADAARTVFRIASKKRDEGVINQTEFLDARNALTTAELNLNLTRFAVLSETAELEYTTAGGVLPLQ